MNDEQEQAWSFRWGIPLLDEGHTTVPNFFFDNYQKAGIGREEFLAILHLARYQFEQVDSVCRPSVATIAEQMGYTARHLRRMLADLEVRGLLVRSFRPGKPTVYDFSGFSRAVLKIAAAASEEMTPDTHVPPTPDTHVPPTPDTHVPPTPDTHVPPPRTPTSPEKEHKEQPKNNGGGGGSQFDKKVCLLVAFGVSEPVARALAVKCSLEVIQGWIEYASNGRGLKDPQGLVVARLRSGERPPKTKAKKSVDETSEERRQRYAGGALADLIQT